jgi:predicted Rossmann fold nucleotide-binding protein DprA/Smf involved in DNA uptake
VPETAVPELLPEECGVIRSITITGTRKTDGIDPAVLYSQLTDVLSPFDHEGAVWFVGGALGMDAYVLRWLMKNSTGQVTVVVPGTLTRQPTGARHYINAALERVNVGLVELDHPSFPKPEAFHMRNRYMVDRSGLVIGFPEKHALSGGTVATLDYAEELGKPRLIYPVGAS